MKRLLTLVVFAASVAAPVFARGDYGTLPGGGPVPDGGATALLAAISFGGLVIAKKVMNKR